MIATPFGDILQHVVQRLLESGMSLSEIRARLTAMGLPANTLDQFLSEQGTLQTALAMAVSPKVGNELLMQTQADEPAKC